MTSPSTAAGSTRPGRWPRRCWPAQGVLVTSATLRGGDGWDAPRRGPGPRHLDAPAERFEAESPFDYAAASEVLIVTDIKPGDIRGAGRAPMRG